MKRKTLERLKAALAADVSANKALGMQTDKDSPPSKKRKMSPEPLPGPSRLANTDIEEIVGKNGKAKDPKKPGKELKRPSEAEALSPKRRKKTEGEEHLAIKPSELEKDADLIDFDIKSFRKDVVVLNNDQIKIILKKVAFKKQNKFKYSDHLFEVAFLPKKNGKAPLLLDLLDFFRLVIVKIVLMLRKYYHKALSDSGKKNIMKVHRQIYGTITSDHMVRGMNSANYSIQTQPELIAFQLTNALFRFLQSYEELRLDRQFGIYFKVLSTSHANFRAWKKHNLDLHIPVGAKVVGFKADPESRAGWKFVAPEGYPQQEKAFSGRCLLISVIIGVLYNGWLQNPISDCGRKWEIVRNIHSKDLEQKNSAGRLLQNEMNTLLAHSNLSAYSKKDYIEDTLPVLSKYFNVQITVHSERANNRITCVFPPKFMHNMCQIHLYQTMNYGDSVDHVDFILNRRTLIQKHGMVHNCCYVFSHGPQVGHLCRSQESCLCCRRQILKLDSYVNEEIKEITCNSNTFPGVFEKCKICGLMKKSYDCGQYHDKYCCQKGFLCGNCNKYISISSRWKTVEAIKVGHKCLTKLCKTCFEYYPVEEDHSCLLRPVQLQKYHHNLGMIDFEYLAQKIDPNTFELVPVQASILFEDGEKETFTEKQFLDEKFGHSEPADRQIVMPYMMELDHMSTMSKKLAACERVGRFSKPFSKKSKKSILEKCQTKVTSNVTERLVNFIVTRKFQSYTFIVWSENQLKTIMKQLIVMRVTPKVLHSQSKYHLVTIPQFDITFVSRESYVVGTLEELRSTYATKVPIQFYPRDFLTEETMTYVGERPSCELFLRSEHSNKEQNEIKKWYHDQEHKKTWSLANELVTFCSYKMRIFSATLMAFLSYAFKLQSEMWKFFPATSGTEGVPLFSPFSYPITSVGALSFTLYRYFGLRSQLCAVNYETGRPNFKSSQGELELVSFLTELVSPSEVNTSFSIHDQKSFQHIRPDFYCEEKKYAACFQGNINRFFAWQICTRLTFS